MMGMIWNGLERPAFALPMFEKTLAIKLSHMAENDVQTAGTRGLLGQAYATQRQFAAAREQWEKVVEIRMGAGDHLKAAIAQNKAAEMFRGEGKHAEALEMATRSLELKKGTLAQPMPGWPLRI